LTHAQHPGPSTAALAFAATRHCLTGCAIGEIVGTLISSALGLPTTTALLLGIVLAFVFGYSLTFVPLLQAAMPVSRAIGITLAADTVSIVVMELVDNTFVVLVPGAMSAGVNDPLFWGSLLIGLVIAFAAAYPVNLWLVGRGRGHALTQHGGGHH
jgi:Na+-transporting NADH:ubiquinone oxidoreductase subunit NqrD